MSLAAFVFYGGGTLGLCAAAVLVVWLSDFTVRSS
jgi:hypothetical protein